MQNVELSRGSWWVVQADGFGRRDYAVHGACICGDADDADRCDGSCNVPADSGLTRAEAEQVLELHSIREVDEFLLALPAQRFVRDRVTGRARANSASPANV